MRRNVFWTQNNWTAILKGLQILVRIIMLSSFSSVRFFLKHVLDELGEWKRFRRIKVGVAMGYRWPFKMGNGHPGTEITLISLFSLAPLHCSLSCLPPWTLSKWPHPSPSRPKAYGRVNLEDNWDTNESGLSPFAGVGKKLGIGRGWVRGGGGRTLWLS